ncbi:hypothetical protein ACFWBR_43070 [Streptomyces sp. NPDC060006]|uniref:hypothetical protein n=1 Tax=unclassified Streptomyces TaxID=2593676 RepID=UPI00368F6EC8
MSPRAWLITGIEGFCESVAQEVAPFGIGVMIVEPGGARTEFRYGSAQPAGPLPEYEGNPAHAYRAMLDPANGLALGDPARTATRIPHPCAWSSALRPQTSTIDTRERRLANFRTQDSLAASMDFPQGE